MIKNPIIKLPEIEETEKYKSKHKKSKTSCKDKRKSYLNCGICGSEDVAEQGVVFCEKCEQEKEHFTIEIFFGRYPKVCDCEDSWKYFKAIYVKKCLVCGAVEARTCPACGGFCWTGIYREKYCKRCGFRSSGYKK